MIITVKDIPEIIDPDKYYDHPAMSNSKLGELEVKEEENDPTEVYAFGNLVDHMITEPDKVDVYRNSCDGHVFTSAQMQLAKEMRIAFHKDSLCSQLSLMAEYQKIMLKELHHDFGKIQFSIQAKCKWDMWFGSWGGDIKTTTAETQEQFEAAARFFHYPRQRFLYMTLGGSEKDILIGISKKNLKIFRIPIRKGDAFWNEGKEDYERLVVEYWKLYGN